MKPKKVAVSACLLGELCRYDGTSKPVEGVREALDGIELIPFCPEAPPLGVPRGRISVIRTRSGYRLWRDADDGDVTDLIVAEIEKLLAAHPDIDMVVLKSKSPSCGFGTTPILNENRQMLRHGNGVAAQYFRDHRPDIIVLDETQFLKERF
jgi:uncharacterized protein YbbK (DUF523 family)